MRKLLTISTLLIAGFTGGGAAHPDHAHEEQEHSELAERFGDLRDLCGGVYEIEATWADGAPIYARNVYTPVLGGAFMHAITTTNDADGELYDRYLTIYSATDEGAVTAHGFTYDGTIQDLAMTAATTDAGHTAYRSSWSSGPGTTIKQEIVLDRPDSYAWRVWFGSEADDQWEQIMDGRWRRTGSADEHRDHHHEDHDEG